MSNVCFTFVFMVHRFSREIPSYGLLPVLNQYSTLFFIIIIIIIIIYWGYLNAECRELHSLFSVPTTVSNYLKAWQLWVYSNELIWQKGKVPTTVAGTQMSFMINSRMNKGWTECHTLLLKWEETNNIKSDKMCVEMLCFTLAPLFSQAQLIKCSVHLQISQKREAIQALQTRKKRRKRNVKTPLL